MTQTEAKLNSFLVNVFNDILHLEEENIASGGITGLSVSELHVLEQIDILSAAHEDVGMSRLADALCVTGGTLSIAVRTLEQKGYVKRTKADCDKRRVYISLCDKAYPALSAHTAFHDRLVQHACSELTEYQIDCLITALDGLHRLFGKEISKSCALTAPLTAKSQV